MPQPVVRVAYAGTEPADKNVDEVFRLVAPVASTIIATEFAADSTGRRAPLPAAEVGAAARRVGARHVVVEGPIEGALRRGVQLSEGAPVIVTGSFFAVANAGAVTRVDLLAAKLPR